MKRWRRWRGRRRPPPLADRPELYGPPFGHVRGAVLDLGGIHDQLADFALYVDGPAVSFRVRRRRGRIVVYVGDAVIFDAPADVPELARQIGAYGR